MRRTFVFTAALLACACSDGRERQRTATPEELADALCSLLAPCCEAQGLPTDGAVCHALLLGAAANQAFHGEAAAECIADMEAQAAAGGACGGGTTPSCDRVFGEPGTARPGETCREPADCAPSADGRVGCIAYVPAGSVEPTGVCTIERTGGEGAEPCVGDLVGTVAWVFWNDPTQPPPVQGWLCDRAQGVYCGAEQRCVPLGAPGDPCHATDECRPTAWCDHGSGTCAARVGAGAPCLFDDLCTTDTFCDPATLTCTARAPIGASCTGQGGCVLGASCVGGTCRSADLGFLLMCGSP